MSMDSFLVNLNGKCLCEILVSSRSEFRAQFWGKMIMGGPKGWDVICF
jgi:hypothetical protein